MGVLNTIYPPYDKEVKFRAIWTAPQTWNLFTEIKCIIGGETYSTIADPDELFIESDTVLVLKIGAVTVLDKGTAQCCNILGYDADHLNGIPLNVESANKLDPVKISEVC